MRARRPSRAGLAAAGALATVCGCLLALLAALSLTLFREGFYLHKLEQSTALQTIYDNVVQGARTVAETAGLRAGILDGLVEPEDVRVAVVRRADEIWHGTTEQPASPYADAVTYLQDTVSRETGELWDEADAALYRNIQLICDDMWRTNAVPPLANLLNLLMQYRRVAWGLMAVLAVLLAVCLWLLAPFSRDWQQLTDAVYGVGAAVALSAALGMALLGGCGWQGWMPAGDPAYGLYLDWFGALPPVLAACGSALAGLIWIAGLYPYVQAQLRRPAGRRAGHKARARVK